MSNTNTNKVPCGGFNVNPPLSLEGGALSLDSDELNGISGVKVYENIYDFIESSNIEKFGETFQELAIIKNPIGVPGEEHFNFPLYYNTKVLWIVRNSFYCYVFRDSYGTAGIYRNKLNQGYQTSEMSDLSLTLVEGVQSFENSEPLIPFTNVEGDFLQITNESLGTWDKQVIWNFADLTSFPHVRGYGAYLNQTYDSDSRCFYYTGINPTNNTLVKLKIAFKDGTDKLNYTMTVETKTLAFADIEPV